MHKKTSLEPVKHLFIFILLISSFFSFAQEKKLQKYYGYESFLIEGTDIANSLKESRYDRLPLSYKERVRKPVWDLSKNAAGLSIRFFSNTTTIRVKWTLLNNTKMNHMAQTGIGGVDLYFNNNGKWQYVNTGKPSGFENEFTMTKNMSSTLREYKIYLPLYDGVKNIEIGIDSNSTITKALKTKSRPIIFYGTSITQGGCASRPGMVHTNIISRNLNIDCINFGFSGNGAMEQPINELIAESNPLFYVIECLPNMTPEQVTARTAVLVKTIRAKHAKTPIVFVDNFIYETSFLDQKMAEDIKVKNTALQVEFEKIAAAGIRNIIYIDAKNATGVDYEGAVDGVHFTDLGYSRYADFLMKNFAKHGLIPTKTK